MSARDLRSGGFTLLELLIVLAIIGIMVAVVVPGLARTYDAIAASGERADVARALGGLPLLARTRDEALLLSPRDPDSLRLLPTLPEGWTVSLLEPLRIERSGVCHPARVRVSGRGRSEVWRLTAPACGVDDAP